MKLIFIWKYQFFEDRGNCFAFSAERYKYFDTRLDSLSLFESGLVKYLLTFSMLKIESLFDIKNIMVSSVRSTMHFIYKSGGNWICHLQQWIRYLYTCFSYNLKITCTQLTLDIFFPSNHNCHKSSYELLWMFWFDGKKYI